MKGEVEQLKNKFDKLKRTKRGITYINILHTLQKVERKLDKLERKLLGKLKRNTTRDSEKLRITPKENLYNLKFFIFFILNYNKNVET